MEVQTNEKQDLYDTPEMPVVRALQSEMHVSARAAVQPEFMADVIAAELTAEDFFERTPRLVMQAAQDLFSEGALTSHEVVRSELYQRGNFEQIGEEAWSDFVGFGWDDEDFPYHARRVKQASRLREKSEAMRKGHAGINGGGSMRAREEAAEEALWTLLRLRAEESETVQRGADMAAEMEARLESEEEETIWLPTGFYSFDRMFKGVAVGRMTIVAARSNHGKSLWADTVAVSCARRFKKQTDAGKPGKVVLKFDLENGLRDVQTRLLAGIASSQDKTPSKLTVDAVEAHLEGKQVLTDSEMKLAKAGNDELKGLPLVIDEYEEASPEYMRSRAMAEAQRADVGLIIADYAEIIPADGQGKTQQVMNVGRQLHYLAKSLGAAVLLVSQTNKNQMNRSSGEPHVGDIAWGDSLTKYAKSVIMPFNPHEHWTQTGEEGPEPDERDFDVWMRKNKGANGLCSLKIDPDVPMLYDPNEPQEPWPSGDGASRPTAPVPSDDTPF